MKVKPPRAEKKLQVISEHEDAREDYYFWLRDQHNPEVIQYIEAENNYLQQSLQHTEQLQSLLFSELKGRIKEDDTTPPTKDGNYWYYRRYEKDMQYPIYCRRIGSADGPEEIILDQNILSKGLSFCSLGFLVNSPNHRYIAYSIDDSGNENYKIYIKDLETGQIRDIGVENGASSLVWFHDSETFLYTCLDENLRPRFVYRYNLKDPHKTELIYEEQDSGFFVWLDQAEDESSLFIVLSGNNTSEVWYTENRVDAIDFQCITPRRKNHEYEVSALDGDFLILSNWKAMNYCLYRAKKGSTNPDSWVPWQPYDESVLTEGMVVFLDFVAIQERHRSHQRIRIVPKNGEASFFIDNNDEPCSLNLHPSREYETKNFRYSYSTLNIPQQIIEYDYLTKSKSVIKQQEVPDPAFDSRNYKIKKLFVKSRDGVEIPVTLIYHKSTKLDASAPLLLYAYGSYGASLDASFGVIRLSYVDRGLIYAVAHVRGGMELGRQWYLDGKLLNKKNTFNDFIDVAEGLIGLGYTATGRIIAKGGSAGGLLMGAIANERPDLFAAVIAEVPFVDTLNTMLDDSLPLTTIEYNEWGNPNKKEYYDYIKSYSPYDNIKRQPYPAVLAICGLNDMRVTYWEPAKWVAKLREYNTGDRPIYLRTHMEAGHAGASGRYDYLQDAALEIAFTLEVVQRYLA